MGKVCECSCLCSLLEPPNQPRKVHFNWQGQLSHEQEYASEQIIKAIKQKSTLLIGAVTGAGKTEMLFKGLHYALEQGFRICIAAPRIDVCLELAPRIQAVFPNEPLAVLYSDSPKAYGYTKLVIATTHQLLKFKAAFDLLIIDEVDAFPFQNNQVLQDRIPVALKTLHSLIYLTATPSKKHQQAVKSGELLCVNVPARYHQHALPIPQFVYVGDWKFQIAKKQPCKILIKLILEKFKKQRKFLLFLPHIDFMHQLERQLKQYLPCKMTFTSVHAQDDDRIDKVQCMRAGKYDFLLTTTILERGVTFANIDVIILGSEDAIFSTAALVQIAGRVGRKADYPTGEVTFLHHGKTRAMVLAKKRLVQMNKLAKQRGLIQ